MAKAMEGFAFNDYCQKCQKVTQHTIHAESRELYGVCSSCSTKRHIMEPQQVYYPKTDLWVTRFKIGNLPGVVAGKLLDAARHHKETVK